MNSMTISFVSPFTHLSHNLSKNTTSDNISTINANDLNNINNINNDNNVNKTCVNILNKTKTKINDIYLYKKAYMICNKACSEDANNCEKYRDVLINVLNTI